LKFEPATKLDTSPCARKVLLTLLSEIFIDVLLDHFSSPKMTRDGIARFLAHDALDASRMVAQG
jgi:hypothetical protein